MSNYVIFARFCKIKLILYKAFLMILWQIYLLFIWKYWVEKEIISYKCTYHVIFSLFQNQYIKYYSNIPIYKLFRIFSTFNVIILECDSFIMFEYYINKIIIKKNILYSIFIYIVYVKYIKHMKKTEY